MLRAQLVRYERLRFVLPAHQAVHVCADRWLIRRGRVDGGPDRAPDTSGKVPHYKHDAKKMTMSARGINVRKLNVMLTKACKEQQPFVAVTLHSSAYTLKAKRLLRSCTRVGICCKATQAPESFGPEAPEGSEEFRFQLIAMKPAFILSSLELHGTPSP